MKMSVTPLFESLFLDMSLLLNCPWLRVSIYETNEHCSMTMEPRELFAVNSHFPSWKDGIRAAIVKLLDSKENSRNDTVLPLWTTWEMEILSMPTLKDLCIIFIIKGEILTEEKRSLLPGELLQDIDFFSSEEKDIINAVFFNGRLGLYPLINDVREGMYQAARYGDRRIVEYFINRGANDWNYGMYAAAHGGHPDLVKFFISKGADDWNWGMTNAAWGNHLSLIEFFISKGAEEWNRGLIGAARGGHLHLVEFFIARGANHFNAAMRETAEGGHMDLVKFFISKGADNWNMGLRGAARGNHKDLVEFFVEKGADNWDIAMWIASGLGNKEIVEFFVSKGVTDWHDEAVTRKLSSSPQSSNS